jgi:hypothetical protein
VWTKEYRKRTTMASPSAATYVAAQSASLGQILGELARDLAAERALR